MLLDAFIPAGRKGLTAGLAALGLVAAFIALVPRFGIATEAFGGMLLVDGFASFLDVVFLASGLFGIALAYDYLKRMGIERGEYYSLLLFSVCGMMLMGRAGDLIVVFLALELLSIRSMCLPVSRFRAWNPRNPPQVLLLAPSPPALSSMGSP
jgi:NADH-quinone oxidoreductase subunit N